MNVRFHTLGCKVNQYETQVMREIFINKGFTANSNVNPDVIVINSCTVTAESDRKVRQLTRKCRKENPNSIIVLTGCMVEAFPEKSKEIPEADIILGNRNFSKIADLVLNFSKNKEKIFSVEAHQVGDKYNTPSLSDFSERTRAYMKIEDGCDRFCSYCIIPFARGRVRSRSLDEIRSEAQILSEKGFCEIVLVGINLSAYGKGENFDICDAVDAAATPIGIKRIRLGSLEPDHITDEMLLRLKNQKKFCPQFHLSLQSGCDETLKRMNRKYDTTFYRDLIKRIRSAFKNASITTDIMVGFAGETDEEFEKSIKFADEIGFARTHIFPYSRRNGTVAAALKSQVASEIKAERAAKMAEISTKSERRYNKSFLGIEVAVLFETPENSFAVGYTENYIRVKVETTENLIGMIKTVKITEAFNDYCIGILI